MDIASMNDNVLKSQAFKLKGRLYTFTTMQLLTTDSNLLALQMDAVIAKAPRLFDRAPIVLDCTSIKEDGLDLQALCQAMRERSLIPVAIQGGSPLLETLAQCQGLAVLNATSTRDKTVAKIETTVDKPVNKTKLLSTPVRSGQQIVSKGGDLIITSTVSHGAELLADGNIHVYGALRGRALAGIAGDKKARIFCQSLHAELVAIAGYYCLSDSMPSSDGPCQIFLKDESIQVEPL